jgi:hypothetical protein
VNQNQPRLRSNEIEPNQIPEKEKEIKKKHNQLPAEKKNKNATGTRREHTTSASTTKLGPLRRLA